MEDVKWFLLDLPPVNLYTVNLLQPYWNGVESMRQSGIVQPTLLYTDKVDKRVTNLLDLHNAKKVCIKKCKLDKITNTCTGCKRTLQEIIDAGNSQRKETL